MTKLELNDLYDKHLYGHDADISIEKQRFFIEWEEEGISVYKMIGDEGYRITSFLNDNRRKVVEDLFNFQFLTGKSLYNSYKEIMVLDIE